MGIAGHATASRAEQRAFDAKSASEFQLQSYAAGIEAAATIADRYGHTARNAQEASAASIIAGNIRYLIVKARTGGGDSLRTAAACSD